MRAMTHDDFWSIRCEECDEGPVMSLAGDCLCLVCRRDADARARGGAVYLGIVGLVFAMCRLEYRARKQEQHVAAANRRMDLMRVGEPQGEGGTDG